MPIDGFDEERLTGPVLTSQLGIGTKVKKKKVKFGAGLAERAREVGTLRPTLSSISTPLREGETARRPRTLGRPRA